jgi:hypothetical protein
VFISIAVVLEPGEKNELRSSLVKLGLLKK